MKFNRPVDLTYLNNYNHTICLKGKFVLFYLSVENRGNGHLPGGHYHWGPGGGDGGSHCDGGRPGAPGPGVEGNRGGVPPQTPPHQSSAVKGGCGYIP